MNESLTFAEALANFHFLRPWWLLALLPGFWLVRTVWRRNAHGSAWQQAIDPDLLPWLLDKRPGRAQRAPVILLSVVWFISIVALAGPTWNQIPYPAQERQSALVIVLDQSLAMTVDDVSPDRQTVARRKLLDILDQREEGQTGLVVYAGEAHVVTPLTEDNVTMRALVPALSPDIMPAQGNNPAHGVELALELLNESRSGTGHILLMTSGVAAGQRQRIESMVDGTPFVLSTIGVGTTDGGPILGPDGDFLRNDSGQTLVSSLDRQGLQSLADSLGGGYQDLTLGSEDIDRLLGDTVLPGEGEFADALQEFDIWNDLGPWLLLLVLPLTAFIFRRGWLLGLALTGIVVLGSLTRRNGYTRRNWKASGAIRTSAEPGLSRKRNTLAPPNCSSHRNGAAPLTTVPATTRPPPRPTHRAMRMTRTPTTIWATPWHAASCTRKPSPPTRRH